MFPRLLSVLKNIRSQHVFDCHYIANLNYKPICHTLNKVKCLNKSAIHCSSMNHDSALKKVKLGSIEATKEKVDFVEFIHDKNINDDSINSTDLSLLKQFEVGVLEPCEEDVSDISPFTSPSYNLAAYANKSVTLQEFVKMGVQLHIIERKKEAAECILKLDFENHVKPLLRFLHDNGVVAEEFGNFITKNPFIFEQNLDDLQVRINYLESKKFSKGGISRIITKNPQWLSFSTVDIDKRLGFFQRTFVLSGDEVRQLAVKKPTLITYPLEKVVKSAFAVKEELGFSEQETKDLLLKKPKLFNIQVKNLNNRFDYVHNIMEISHEQIVEQPGILLFRNFIVKQRHEFLKLLGKAQYNPKLPEYVSLDALAHGDDTQFCKNVAKTSIELFNNFLKSS